MVVLQPEIPMKTATSCLLLVLLALPLGACFVAVGAAGGVAAAKYVRNQEARSYRSTLRAAYEATLAALPELGYPAAYGRFPALLAARGVGIHEGRKETTPPASH